MQNEVSDAFTVLEKNAATHCFAAWCVDFNYGLSAEFCTDTATYVVKIK